jgi:CRP/FNR family transcriptional regulator, cyclic AMP receptor protein
MSREVLVETLASVRFLGGVAPNYLEGLADMARVEEYAEGEVLFEEGQAVDDVFLIVKGEVALEVGALGLNPQLLLNVGSGDSLGWTTLLERRHRTATARVTAPTSLIRFDGQQLIEFCKRNPSFGFEVMRKTAAGLATRLHAMRQRFLEVYRLQPASFTCGAEEYGID